MILPDDPRPLLERCIAGLRAAGADPVLAVLRAPYAARCVAAGGLPVVPDPPPAQMIDSVLAALALLEDGSADGLLLCPVDGPRAAEAAPAWLREAIEAAGDQAIVPTWAGRDGHPVWIPRDRWSDLRSEACRRDGTRAALVKALRWPVDDEAVLHNANRPESL